MFNNKEFSLQLIDFGKSIDLRLFPKNISFNQVVKTDGLLNIQMREGMPWREHVDYFGVCATAYCLLFGTYLDVVKVCFFYANFTPYLCNLSQVGEFWMAKGSYKRWWQAELWKDFFHEFLNIKGIEKVSKVHCIM